MQNEFASAPAGVAWPVAAAGRRSDPNLLADIATGDRLAMRTLFARHSVRTYRFVQRIVDDPHRAEDIVSEVFLDIWRQAGHFKGRSKVSTWILAIARFKALTALRQRRYAELDDGLIEAIADGADDPELALQRKDDCARLRICLTQLPPKHREVIDLVYYQEMSVEEAADILGVPPNTVKTRMFYARKRLAGLLQQAESRHAIAAA
jgi:RNA polymerase sigma-70 factor (ECF subfamily)